jgi:hypothetical protein
MVKFNLFLIHEYHQYILHQGQYPPIIIFGSFFDMNSLEFAWWICQDQQLEQFFTQNQNHSLNYSNIVIVFFPVNKNLRVNLELKHQIDHLLGLNMEYKQILPLLIKLQEEALLYLKINQERMNLEQDSKQIILNTTHQQNTFLYGHLTASYLNSMVAFPYICLNSHLNPQIYNGIPLNLNISQFLSNIIAPSIIEAISPPS